MNLEEKKKKLYELAEKYKDDENAVKEYQKDPIAALKKAGLEITLEELKQIQSEVSEGGDIAPKGGGKCSIG